MTTRSKSPVVKLDPKLYREQLTPALHRRFTHAALVSLGVCYLEAIIIGPKDSWIWTWNPIGTAGMRTLLLFISSLAIETLRVSQLHVGARTTAFPFTTFLRSLFRPDTFMTFATYIFSACFFTEVYIWSAAGDESLRLTIQPKPYERSRINEKPVYLRSVAVILGACQAFFHLYYDYGRVPLPATKTQLEADAQKKQGSLLPPALQLIRDAIRPIAAKAAFRATLTAVASPLIYPLLFRECAWSLAKTAAKFTSDVPKVSEPPLIPPFHFWIIIRSMSIGFQLIVLWEITNTAFNAFTTAEPLKDGKPLTSHSKNPNGALMLGLRSKKEVPKSFAFWELLHITLRFSARRMTIFEELDNAGAPTWKRYKTACLHQVQQIDSRIAAWKRSSAARPKMDQTAGSTSLVKLPRMSLAINNNDILTSRPPPNSFTELTARQAGKLAKSYGQSPDWTPQAKEYVKTGFRKLPKEFRTKYDPNNLRQPISNFIRQFLLSPLGQPFRQTFSRNACAIVFGSPTGNLGVVLDAINCLTKLLVCSLKEDPWGKAQADVSEVICVFTQTIEAVEELLQTLPIPRTDVYFDDRSGRNVEEVMTLLKCLSEGLRELIEAFQPYAGDIGLSPRDLTMAKRAAGIEFGDDLYD
ncbi:MAG: hypothetical protein M1834_004546 [Cirrosporium novae-zelandiae]|nr:MAG: hypothetical protein M1834_004546 [Cirrosporium novae-zelandiae]